MRPPHPPSDRGVKARQSRHDLYPSGDLERAVASFVEHYNHHRHNESLDNLTLADICFGRGHIILLKREKIKRQTIECQHFQYRKKAA